MDINGAQLWRHTLIEVAIDKVVVLNGEGSLTMIVLLRQVETNNVSTILLEEAREVSLSAKAAWIFCLIDNNVWLWG